jgi:protocadherin Fat 4
MLDGNPAEDHYNEPVEHYDLDNASSIAPSDIDVIYHYKGYRDGSHGRHRYSGGKSLNSKKRSNYLKHHNTPLARLSPSSEMSHNTPRHILTLGDLSGKSIPSAALLESERSLNLNSPVSHVSAASNRSRHSPAAHLGGRGLTSENVARFNHHQRTAQQKSSTLVNTLDMVSLGSESRKNKTPTVDVDNSSASSSASSADSDNDDDSFTCSEFEYDSAGGGGGGGNQGKTN